MSVDELRLILYAIGILIAACSFVASTALSYLAYRQSRQNTQHIQSVRLEIDGRLDELVRSQHALGKSEGRDEERQNPGGKTPS